MKSLVFSTSLFLSFSAVNIVSFEALAMEDLGGPAVAPAHLGSFIEPSRSDAERFDLLMSLRTADPDFGPNTLCREAMDLCREDWRYTVEYCTLHRGWALSDDLRNWIPDFLAMVSGHRDMATFHQYAFANYFLVNLLVHKETGEALNDAIKKAIDPSAKFNFESYYAWAHKLAEGFDYGNKDFRTEFMKNDRVLYYQLSEWRLKPEMKAPGFIMPIYGPQGEGAVLTMLDGIGTLDPHGGVLQMNVRATGFDSGQLEYDQYVGHSALAASQHDFAHDESQGRLGEKALFKAKRYAFLKEALYEAYAEGTRERALVQLWLWNTFHESIFPVDSLEEVVSMDYKPLGRFNPDGQIFGQDSGMISARHNNELVRSLGLEVEMVPEEDTPEIVWDRHSSQEGRDLTAIREMARKSAYLYKLHHEGKELVKHYIHIYDTVAAGAGE